MKVELLRKWGGKVKGTVLPLEDDLAQNLIKRKFAKEIVEDKKPKPKKGKQ